MAENLAKVVTKENVLKALEKMDPNDPNLRPSTKFDMVYNGRRYPPKEVVREAAKLQGVEEWWEADRYRLSGGESANRHLRAKGFDIKPKADTAKFYIGGSNWGDVDMLGQFTKGGYWENGHKDQFIDEIKSVPVGSLIAIKSTWQIQKQNKTILG